MPEENDPTNPTPPPTPPAPAPPAPPAPPDPDDDLAKMQAALRKANNEAAGARAKLKEIEDATKTDVEKLSERASSAEARASSAETQLLKLQVGAEKGLTVKQAGRLAGTTREELEADADEMLVDFPPAANGAPRPAAAPGGKPREALKPGGGDPDLPPDETDLVKLGERMFR